MALSDSFRNIMLTWTLESRFWLGCTNQNSYSHLSNLLREVLLFREDTEEKLAFLVGLVGGRHNHILPRAQPEALSHLPQVNVGFAASLGRVQGEEFLLHVLLVTMHLTDIQSSKKKKS